MATTLAATAHTWFTLVRFDGEGETPEVETQAYEPEEVEQPDEGAESEAKPKPTETVDYWRRRARDNERRAKENAAKAAKLDEIEAANKSEAEKLAAARDAAEQRAGKALARAVTAEIKALADEYVDRDDAVVGLQALGDLARYAESGDIDVEAIRTDLGDLLDRKPHLRKQAAPTDPPKPKAPRPDPSQGSRGDDKPTDFRVASDDIVKAELERMGVRVR